MFIIYGASANFEITSVNISRDVQPNYKLSSGMLPKWNIRPLKCLAKDLEVNIALEIVLHDFFYAWQELTMGKGKETKQKAKRKIIVLQTGNLIHNNRTTNL